MRIIPAILTDKKDQFESMMEQAEDYTDYVQVDIMDGVFVPSKSMPVQGLADLDTTLSCEIHLMVKNPETLLNNVKLPFIKQILIHIEATDKPSIIISELEKYKIKTGLVINPDTDISLIVPYLNEVKTVMFMTVHPGYYGRPLVKEVLEKVKIFKQKYPLINVGMDGGIKENNLDLIKSTGADFACIGSAICENPDPASAFRKFQKLASA